VIHLAQTYRIRLDQGQPTAAITAARTLLQRRATPGWRGWLANALCAAGEVSEAANQFERAATADFTTIPRNILWRSTMHALTNVAAALGDAERAAQLQRLLQPSSGRIDWFGGGSHGPSDLALGQLAELLGDDDQADLHFKLAIELSRRIQARRHLAYSLTARARLLHRLHQPRATRELATEANAIATDLGLAVVATQSNHLLSVT
jgi:tetratricopeptide (TPR) repeat protein